MPPSRRAPGSAAGEAARPTSRGSNEVVNAEKRTVDCLQRVDLVCLDTFCRDNGTMASVGKAGKQTNPGNVLHFAGCRPAGNHLKMLVDPFCISIGPLDHELGHCLDTFEHSLEHEHPFAPYGYPGELRFLLLCTGYGY